VTSTEVSRITQLAQDQYEALPYPHRVPEDEKTRLLMTGTDDLAAINQYCFRGRQDFCSGFRVLVAGGGTGDATIFLGTQLNATDAKIIHLDLSRESIEVARSRARHRGIEDRIEWVQGSLLEVADRGWEPFDYINCSGVLHHLSDPNAGLAALKSVLKPEGAIAIMVYGQYGRTGVYQMQDLLRLATGSEDGVPEKLATARRVLDAMPKSNWLQHSADWLPGFNNKTDVEIYDMLLHSSDRAYTVPQLYEFLDSAGMNFVEFTPDARTVYQPELVIQEPHLRQRLLEMPLPQRQAFGELYWGLAAKHTFWASAQTDTVANVSDPDIVPVFSTQAEFLKIPDTVRNFPKGEPVTINATNSGLTTTVRFDLDEVAYRLIHSIGKGKTLNEIAQAIYAELPQKSSQSIWHTCCKVIASLQQRDWVLLEHASVNRARTARRNKAPVPHFKNLADSSGKRRSKKRRSGKR